MEKTARTDPKLSSERNEANRISISPRRKIGALVLLVTIVALLSLFANSKLNRTVRKASPALAPADGRIRVEVLNGAGGAKVAQRVTNQLRASGIDVVEIGNFKSSTVEKTMVIDRSGSRDRAISVAQKLHVPESQIVQQIDKSLFVDVSVVVGKDYFKGNLFEAEK